MINKSLQLNGDLPLIAIIILTKSNPNRVHVCWMIFESHFSLGSGGGVPAIGCGLGRVIVPVII